MGDTDGRGLPSGERTGSTPRPEAVQDPADAQQAEAAEEKPGTEKPTSDWFAPRKAGGPAGQPAAGGPAVPPVPGTPGPGASGMGAGAAVTSGASAPPPPPPPGSGGERRPEQHYRPEGAPPPPPPGGAVPGRSGSVFAAGGNTPPAGTRPPGQGEGPDGPTTGPVTGSSRLPAGTPATARPQQRPGGQDGVPRMSDDTAVLTPQKLAPAPGPGTRTPGAPGGAPGATGGHRAPSGPGPAGLPRPDPAPRPGDPSAPGQQQGFSAPDFPGPAQGVPSGPPPARAAAPAARPKKGRSKLVLAVVGLVVVGGGLYGAGLLMNHSDVPKGTTVLGVDIGGGTRDQAVIKLDAALGNRASEALRLNVGGKTEKLAPDKAGLSLDSQATVRAAAVSDYNPVSVVSSLFGGARVVNPVIPVDEEKLGAALTDLAGVSGSATDGTIRFEPGKAVAVPGKAGKTLDVSHSLISVRDAYRAQVQTGQVNTVELPVVPREPTVTQAELDRAMKEFAEPAMSDLVTIKAGGKEIQFGPAKSLPKILSMKPVNGRLIEVYDKKAITSLLENVFDGITIAKGDGRQHPVTADDVAAVMHKALLGKTAAERTAVIDLDGN